MTTRSILSRFSFFLAPSYIAGILPTSNSESGFTTMRFKNEDGEIKLYAVAGTQTVLLAFDMTEARTKGQFLGFDVSRVDSKGNKTSLNGSKHFKSLLEDATITDAKVKFASLIQSFFWKDYLADPGQKYSYTVRAMFGTPLNFVQQFESTIKVETEIFDEGKHGVFFNYGVTGSQGYSKKKEFGNKPINQLPPADYQKALDYLSRELYNDGLMGFLNDAKSKKRSLYCAFYEIQYMPFLKALKDVKAKCKNIEIVYSAQPEQNKDSTDPLKGKGNKISLTNAGLLGVSHPRTKANQPHNKFMVLCEDEVPIEVWTGSTNITLSGIFGQSNTGHRIRDKQLAAKYKKYWDTLKDNPDLSELSDVSTKIQSDADLTKLKNGNYVFFSPRDLPHPKKTVPNQLKTYRDLIESASNLVCMIFPFNYDEIFKTVYDEEKDYLRLLIFEKMSEAKRAKSKADSDPDLLVTAGAVLDSAVEQFVKEVSPAKTVKGGIKYVHNKIFLIDPLSDDPVVVTGSANFSQPSVTSNDENTVVIKGDKRVADIYLTEFNRLFDHFWPRYLTKISKSKGKGFDKPLDETFTWFVDYHKKNSFHQKRGQLFIKMKGAKKG